MNNGQRVLFGLSTLFAVVLIAFWLNRGYGEISSEAYEYSKALYSACLNQNEDHLNKVEEMLSNGAGLPEHERRWLAAIIEKAQAGNWESASKDARRLMEDQVDY